MSRDIRSYFTGGTKKARPSRISDDGSPWKDVKERTEKPVRKKIKTVILDSDSEEDILPPSPRRKKQSSNAASKKVSSVHSEPDLIPVNIGDIFGKNPVQRSDARQYKDKVPLSGTSSPKGEVKGNRRPPKVLEVISDSSSDDGFSKGSQRTKNHSSVEERLQKEGVVVAKETEEKARRKEEVKLAMTVDTSGKELGKRPHASGSPKVKERGDQEMTVKKSPTPLHKKTEHPNAMDKDTARAEEMTPKRRKSCFGTRTQEKEMDEEDPRFGINVESLDHSEKKRQRAIQYQKYLHREGPRNLGSKEVPKGHPNCLSGLTFLLTGVLDSLERDEAASLIQECGGKVSSSLSKNTSYIVLGNEPGPAKLEKARKLGTKELSEDGLLDLVRTETKEWERRSSNSSGGNRLKRKAVEEEEVEMLPSPSKRCRMQFEQTGEDEKPSLSRKLAYMSQNTSVPQVNLAKGLKGITLKKEDENLPQEVAKGYSKQSQSDISTDEAAQCSFGHTMWVDKYKPLSVKQIIGQQGEKSNVKKLLHWLSSWHRYHGPGGKRPPRPGAWDKRDDGGYFKAALLSGPPGIGKTTSALLVCKELGMDAVELNASDTRSKKLLDNEVSELITSSSLFGYFQADKKKSDGQKKVLVMDEVDGMAGNEDRGGVAALIQLIKDSRIPIICICNDRAHPKIRSLVGHCYDLRFQRPRLKQIQAAMMTICCRENVKVTSQVLENLISSTNQDIRQVIHQLNIWAADKISSQKSDGPPSNRRKDSLKDVRLGPWDVLKKVFSAEERRNTTINQQSDLFFYDYNLGPLFVFENYPKVSPKASRNLKERLSLLAQTAESLAMGDKIQRVIRRDNAWKLLPSQAIFSSVIPGALMEGHLTGLIDFPAFFGKMSTKGKMERLAQEISLHSRVAARATKESIKLDYLSYLRDAILSPLVEESQEQNRGTGGSGIHIQKSLDLMQGYSLLREDLDSMMELTNFPGRPDPMAKVSSKVKAAFTRAYNKAGLMTPYAVTMAVKKRRGGGRTGEEFYEENEGFDDGEDEGFDDGEDEEQEDDVDTDAMVKIKRPSARGGAQGDDGSSGSSGGRGSKKDDGGGGGKGKGKGAGRGGKKCF